MTDIAARNRAIKKTLETVFPGKVRVRGSRGTGYGWVHVNIDYTPLDVENAQALQAMCKRALRDAGIDLGLAYTDDDCRYTMDKCHISFNTCRYWRTFKSQLDGQLWGQQRDTEQWELVE